MTHAMTSTSAENATLPMADDIAEERLSGLWPCPTCKAVLPNGSRNWSYLRRTGYCCAECHEKQKWLVNRERADLIRKMVRGELTGPEGDRFEHLQRCSLMSLVGLDPKHTEPRKGME